MAVKRPTLLPPSNAPEDAVLALIEKGGSVPQTPVVPTPAPTPVPSPLPQEVPARKPKPPATVKETPKVSVAGAKRGPKTGTSRATRNAEEAVHRHTLYMPDDLYQSLVEVQQRQRRPWPSLNTLILQALYDLVERE